jgi:opacity protein-like surface antigen
LTGKNDITALPVYVTVQITPIEQVKEAYLKANIGYTVYSDVNSGIAAALTSMGALKSKESSSGGIYFGVGAGYEFAFGLIVEAMYEYFKCEKEYSLIINNDPAKFNIETSYSQLGLKVGYKFKI